MTINLLEDYEKGFRVETLDDDTICVDLLYPRSSIVKFIEVGLEEVRSADSIRVTYDFERDGWSILQAGVFEWSIEDEVQDSDWQEVAFIQAWSREKKVP